MFPYFLDGSHSRALSVVPKPKYGNPSEQDTDSAGVPKWQIETKIIYTDSDGDPSNEKIRVTIASRTAPDVTEGEPVAFEGLEMGTLEDGRRWFRARSAETVKDMFE